MTTAPKMHLIVGAGPTGLTAAIELRRFGLPVRLIDKADGPARWSQALIVQARTLEQFERYGIAAEAVSRGRIVRAVHFHNGRESLGRLDVGAHIPGRYPFLLCLPQNETEAILLEHLRTLGVEVERGVELLGFHNTAVGDGVTARLRHADGREEQDTYRFLLGCDGAHSRVRSDTLTAFEGDTVPLRFALGDLQLTGPDVPGANAAGEGDELSLFFHAGGWAMLVLLLPNGDYRVITVFPGEEGAPTPAPPTLQSFNADFARFGLGITATRASWLSPFRVNERKAEHYRHGSVFLLGDAAHIHSPVGGQGMNTGLQDAANLAWKLHAVAAGAPPALLDSYDAERGAVARDVLRGSSLGLRVAGSGKAWVEQLRNFMLPHLLGLKVVEDLAARSVSETGIQYRRSTAVSDGARDGPLRAGDRMPNARRADGGTLLEPLRQAGHQLLAVDMPGNAVPRDLKRTAILEVKSREPGQLGESGRLGDSALAGDAGWTPRLETLLGHGPMLYLIRPDGYIGFRGTEDGEELRGYARSVGLLA